jgi:hypothetical protein
MPPDTLPVRDNWTRGASTAERRLGIHKYHFRMKAEAVARPFM